MQAWQSDTLPACPSLGEWLVALPDQALQPIIITRERITPVEKVDIAPVPAQMDNSQSGVQRLMNAAQRKRQAGDTAGAVMLYRALLALDDLPAGQRREVEALLAEDAPPTLAPEPAPAVTQRRLNWKWAALIALGIVVLAASLLILPDILNPATDMPAAMTSAQAPVAATATVTLALPFTETPMLPTLTATMPKPTEDLGPTQTLVALKTSIAQKGYLSYEFSPSYEYVAISTGPGIILKELGNLLNEETIIYFSNTDRSRGGVDHCPTYSSQQPNYPGVRNFAFYSTKNIIKNLVWDSNSQLIAFVLDTSTTYECFYTQKMGSINVVESQPQKCYAVNIINSSKKKVFDYCERIQFGTKTISVYSSESVFKEYDISDLY